LASEHISSPEGSVARVGFHDSLNELLDSLEVEAQLVLRSIRGATEACISQDAELAAEVIAFDDEIDGCCVEVQRGVETLLARQTPVATDLRLVLSILYSNLHLERMGDQCTTIAKLTQMSVDLPPDPVLLEGFREMGERAEEMTRIAMHSLRTRDVAAAESLMDLDELIDRANRRVVSRVLELGSANLEWGIRMILVSRCLERIGDNAVDIGEQTAFLVTGELREFTDASHQQRRT
jgi:phosphate transport system protein